MAPGHTATWLPSLLCLVQALGCLALSGPRRVTGIVGGSLSVRCRYEERYTENTKYWCRNPCSVLNLNKIVETTKTRREMRRGRVSIRDDPANRTFTVTLERLREEDGDTYWCGIHETLVEDLTFKVVVTVIPASPTARETFTNSWGTPFSLSVITSPGATRPETPEPSQQPQSLLSSVHFLLLVFLKLPLLLGMLGAVLWVSRPLPGSGGRGGPQAEHR